MIELSSNNQENLKLMNFMFIVKDIKSSQPTFSIELEFVRRITSETDNTQKSLARNYFNGDFSAPILNYVARYVYNSTYYREIMGEYFEFISKENKNMEYYKLTLYRNINNSTLRHYVTTITIRYFVDRKKKRDNIERQIVSIDGASKFKKEENGKDVIDNPWFNLLIGNDGNEDNQKISSDVHEKIKYVLSKLPLRDVKVIELMVMHNMSGLDAFEELEDELSKTAKIPVSTWTTKQKQNAMALQKARALKHFKKIITDEKINF